jgi:hypothetical protein
VWNAGMEASREMVREPGGDAPPRDERHGWLGWCVAARSGRRLGEARLAVTMTARSISQSSKSGLRNGPCGVWLFAGLVPVHLELLDQIHAEQTALRDQILHFSHRRPVDR